MIQGVDWGIQDRGPWIGYPHIFVHVELASIELSYPARHLSQRGSYTSDEAIEVIQSLSKKPCHALAVVGGDPLIAVDTIIPVISVYKGHVYVETPGVFPDRILECADWVNSWCIDVVSGYETEALESIQSIQDETTCYARVTVSANTTLDEIRSLADGLGMIGGQVPVIVQPVGAFSGLKDKASEADIFRVVHWLKKSCSEVRVVLPTHRLVGR